MKKYFLGTLFIVLLMTPFAVFGQADTQEGLLASWFGDAFTSLGALAAMSTTLTGYITTITKMQGKVGKQVTAAVVALATTALGGFGLKMGFFVEMPVWEIAASGVVVAISSMGLYTLDKMQALLAMLGAFIPKK